MNPGNFLQHRAQHVEDQRELAGEARNMPGARRPGAEVIAAQNENGRRERVCRRKGLVERLVDFMEVIAYIVNMLVWFVVVCKEEIASMVAVGKEHCCLLDKLFVAFVGEVLSLVLPGIIWFVTVVVGWCVRAFAKQCANHIRTLADECFSDLAKIAAATARTMKKIGWLLFECTVFVVDCVRYIRQKWSTCKERVSQCVECVVDFAHDVKAMMFTGLEFVGNIVILTMVLAEAAVVFVVHVARTAVIVAVDLWPLIVEYVADRAKDVPLLVEYLADRAKDVWSTGKETLSVFAWLVLDYVRTAAAESINRFIQAVKEAGDWDRAFGRNLDWPWSCRE